MITSRLVELATEVTDLFNEGPFGFTAERQYVPEIAIENLGDQPHAFIRVSTEEFIESSLLNRGQRIQLLPIEIALAMKATPNTLTQGDYLLSLIEEVDIYFFEKETIELSEMIPVVHARWVGSRLSTPFSQEELRNAGVAFTSLIVNYKLSL